MFGFPTEEQKKNPRHYFEDGIPWSSFDNPYNFPHLKADLVPLNSPVPTGPWRAVFYPPTVFARESFMDEMAHAAGQDSIEFRLHLLEPGDILKVGDARIDRSRLIRVLQVAAEKAEWKRPFTQTGGRRWGCGVACNDWVASAAALARCLRKFRQERGRQGNIFLLIPQALGID